MKFDFPHQLGAEVALERVKRLCSYLQKRHGINVTWTGNKGVINGKYLVVKIEGNMAIEESNVHFEGRDPGMLWRKKASEYLQKKLGAYLDPNTATEDLPDGSDL